MLASVWEFGRIRFALVISSLLLGACGDDSGAGTGVDASAADVRFTELYQNVLHKRCADAVCHGGGAGNLDFTTQAKAYAALVDTQADGPDCKSSGLTRVVAGKPNESLMYEKLSPTPPCGRRMPLGNVLSTSETAMVREWIAGGAPND